MLHLTLKSEYSFGQCYGYLGKLHDNHSFDGVVGVADTNTFSFYKLQKLCEKSGVKPVFGYRCTVVGDATEKVKPRGQFGKEYIIIAKNEKGLKEIFGLTKVMSQNFYYRGNVSKSDIESLSENVFVISNDPCTLRLDYIGMGFTTPDKVRNYNYPKLFIDENFYESGKDKKIYQLYAGRNSNDKSCPQSILDEVQARHYFGDEPVDNLRVVADAVERFSLPMSDNVKYKENKKIRDVAVDGAASLGVDLNNAEYKERFEKELKLIEDKGYSDYLLVVAELIKAAKEYALLGPGRGSSGGSLICYLIGITTFDPIPYGLVFERFIDVNRYDPPDVDFDVPDKYRGKVVKWMEKRYGVDNVKTISNITKFKPKSAIGEFAKAMSIPSFETEAVKDVIIHRAAGDARSAFALEDTFKNTDVGKEFIEKFPEMKNVTFIENHAKTKGKHAAGVIVCNEPLTNYCGIDERDQTVYLDKKDAEALNLLKIDTLGLRTLSVLQDCARAVGMDYKDFYTLPVDDEKAYKVFSDKRLGGIFQFEGETMASINHSAPMGNFTDIVAAGALGRPGALSSGGTSRYIQLKNGVREQLYYCDKHRKITEETFGIVVYQEQMMALCREISGMSWSEVSDLRRAASKSLGEEFFDKYRVKFVEGAVALSGYDEETANKAWLDISSMGCLSGDTLIKNPFPNQNQPQTEIKLKDLYEAGGYSSKERLDNCEFRAEFGYDTKDCLKQNIYMVCEDGAIRPNRLIDVYESGLKETFQLTVKSDDGIVKQIRATKDHKFMVPGMSFKRLSELDVGDLVVMMSQKKRKPKHFKGVGSGGHNQKGKFHEVTFERIRLKLLADNKLCQVCNSSDAVEVHHIDGNHINNDDGNHVAICRSCHRKAHVKLGDHGVPHTRGKMQEFSKIVSIDTPLMEMTYDIAMPAPNNFIANGFAVHNSYAFNKAHSVAYGYISYWCAYMKAHFPLEFVASILNNSKDDETSLKILREFYETEDLKFKSVDTRLSGVHWELRDGELIGGLTNIKGVGVNKANEIIKMRKGDKKFTPGLMNVLENPVTPFDVLYPTLFHFGDLYKNPMSYGLTSINEIKDVNNAGDYAIIGRMIYIDDIDVNDVQSIAKRGGEVLDGPHMKVHIKVEDDSGVMMCIIGRFVYEQLAHEFLREKVGKAWYCLTGKVMEGTKILFVKQVASLNKQVGLRDEKEVRDDEYRRMIMRRKRDW